jgi:DNA polymerase-3 subunit delta'
LRPDGSLAHPGGHTGHPDFLQISYGINDKARPPRPRTEIVIDQMRRLSEQMALTAQYGDAKIAIIEPADAINHAGANALLKTLEEPVPGRYLWLVSANPARLSATIRSRCQKLEFRLPARDEALAWLLQQGHAESAAAEALDAARGHPGLADEWLQGDGLAVRRQVAGDLEKLAAGDIAVVETAQRWVADSDVDLRLRFAADLALSAAADGLTDPVRTRSLAAWFDRANRARELLRSTVRADLVVVELLMAWRAGEARRATRRTTTGKQR